MFAALPSQGRVTSQHTLICAELVRHWQYYIAKSQTLQKAFISIKGVYFQAEIIGEPVTWLAPHQFTQAIPKEVDFRVMMCFLEFYEVFLKFVLFKLFHNLDLRYPPVVNQDIEDAGGCLLAVEAVGNSDGDVSGGAQSVSQLQEASSAKAGDATVVQNKRHQRMIASSASRISTLESHLQTLGTDLDDGGSDEDDEGPSITQPLGEAFNSMTGDASTAEDEKSVFSRGSTYDVHGAKITLHSGGEKRASLFQGLVFFVSREVPLDWMQLLVISGGGSIGWDGEGSPLNSSSSSITHFIIDRPLDSNQKQLLLQHQREFIQPQWLFDSLNTGVLLPISRYSPGVALPPHLSPFVDDQKEGYVPKYREELQVLAGKDSSNVLSADAAEGLDSESDEGEDYEKGIRAEKAGNSASKSKTISQSNGEVVSEEDEDDGSDSNVESEKKANVSIPVASARGPKGVVYERKQGKAVTEVTSNNFKLSFLYVLCCLCI